MIVIRGKRSAARDANSIAHGLPAVTARESTPNLLVRRRRPHRYTPPAEAVVGRGIDFTPSHTEALACAYREPGAREPDLGDRDPVR